MGGELEKGLFKRVCCEAQVLKLSGYSMHWLYWACFGAYFWAYLKMWMLTHSISSKSNFIIYTLILKRKSLLNTYEYTKRKEVVSRMMRWEGPYKFQKNVPFKFGNKNSHHSYSYGKTNDTTGSHCSRVHFNKSKADKVEYDGLQSVSLMKIKSFVKIERELF